MFQRYGRLLVGRFYLLVIRVLSLDATSTHARQIGNFYFRLGCCKPATVLLGLITRFSLWKTSKVYNHNGAVVMTHNVTLASLMNVYSVRNFYRQCNSISTRELIQNHHLREKTSAPWHLQIPNVLQNTCIRIRVTGGHLG